MTKVIYMAPHAQLYNFAIGPGGVYWYITMALNSQVLISFPAMPNFILCVGLN